MIAALTKDLAKNENGRIGVAYCEVTKMILTHAVSQSSSTQMVKIREALTIWPVTCYFVVHLTTNP